MKLTKLEIKGFKSFGDKVILHFDEGITGIVGPNGCGKSNVVDAIRWVLGEQKTRILRSDSMEGVIFNGTSSRKPTQLAEVSLTFDNTKNILPTEYTQVTVTRRYYRSGDSEYLLNGVPCRLKDINSLFLDTGIGPDTYAIIELKMVEGILDEKGASRRTLFEEAAGVSKFKIRKKETLNKLGDTDENLERLEDVLFEINKNLKSLERQAKQAESYFVLNQDKKKYGIALGKLSTLSLTKSIGEIDALIKTENDKKSEIEVNIATADGRLEKEKLEQVTKEKTLSSRQKTLNDHVNLIRKFESEKKISNERLKYLNDRGINLRDQLDQDKKIVERSGFSIKGLEDEKLAAIKILEELKKRKDQLENEYRASKELVTGLNENIQVSARQLKEKENQLNQYVRKMEINRIQIDSLKTEFDKTINTQTEHSSNLTSFAGKITELSQALEVGNKSLEQFKKNEEALTEKLEKKSAELETLKEEINQANRTLDAKQNEYSLTKSMVDNLEGFPEAIKFLKKNAAWGKEAPLLSDILTCHEDYRLSIENYLEPLMNYYVVDSEEHALQAVNLLSDSAKGKANFFVLNKFEKVKESGPRFEVGYTPSIEIVEFDSKYRNLISHLLHNVFIVENNHMSMPDDEKLVFITKNARFVSRKRSISGGSVGLFEGKRIGRAKNLEKLQQEIKSLSSTLTSKKSTLDKLLNEISGLKNSSKKEEIDLLTASISQTAQEYSAVKARQEQFQNMIESNTGRKEEILQKIAELEREMEETIPKKQTEELAINQLQFELESLTKDAEYQSGIMEEKNRLLNQENILTLQQDNKVKSIEQDISFKTNTFQISKERIDKNLIEIETIEQDIKAVLQNDLISEKSLIRHYEEKEAIEKGVQEAEKDYYACRGNIDEIEKEIREHQRRRDAGNSIIMELQNKANDVKINLQTIKERVSVEFGVSSEHLTDEGNDLNMPEEELRSKVDAIRDKIERLGPVNPMAKEAYDEIKERHDFILKQKEDLMQAKNSLLQTISEIDEVAKETFLKSFEEIKQNFVRVFQSLFEEGDTCDLKLGNPDDPLESPIEIIAKPKGKRPQTINQLSGGEKTLTATALLFSIYLLKPAPFCVFDEVDAPLDDNNIDKFNNIIKTFSGESQFIIVTHNKRTMMKTDVIYGVTMPEKGVSKLVPVDLRQLDAILET